MTNEFFFNVVEQATQMGYDRFGLTPITGDLFMDKHVMEKMEFLEQHPKVACYHFYFQLHHSRARYRTAAVPVR